MQKLFTTILLVSLSSFSYVWGENRVTAYFSNDSVNGLKVSDAYETHNMGLKIDSFDRFYLLDLGIVSPDMHIYKNEYRRANRSFGELISFSIGRNQQDLNGAAGSYFFKATASGRFGIDTMQDFMHEILTLQPVNHVNELVRMPNKIWLGVGGDIDRPISNKFFYFDAINAGAYLGNDRMEFSTEVKKTKELSNLSIDTVLGINLVPFDNIVSAPPVMAEHRKLVPHFSIRLNFKYFGLDWFIQDKFSMATISEDDDIYGMLSAGVSFKVD